MVTSAPLVAIIILNWNNWIDTLACVESCRQLSWPNFRIIIVDNDSSDGSEIQLRQHCPDAEIIQTGTNLGFAGGNNVGIRRAIAQSADFIWLLNNDAVADPRALTALVEALAADPSAAIAGSKIFYHDDPRRIWFAGGIWEKGRMRLMQQGANQLDRGQFEEPRSIGSVSGCSMLVRASAIEKIGLMDETYFLYWEDTDWCARSQQGGYSVIFVPASRIWHKVSATTARNSFVQHYYFARNGLHFLSRNDIMGIPVFAVSLLAAGIKHLIFGSILPLQGILLGVYQFLRCKTGPLVLGPDITTGREPGK